MYNNELQIIDDQNKAYLLGLFYADGNVSLKQTHSRIALHEKDVKLLLKIKKVFKFFKLYADKSKNQFTLYSGYKKCKTDLILNGCLPQKSTVNKTNLLIPKLEKDLLRHFIRGYFDGDGGCHLNLTTSKVQKRVYIYSASDIILEQIKEILLKVKIISTVRKITTRELFVLQISTISYLDFYKFLYEGSNLKMNRKFLLFNKLLNTKFFIQKKAPKCKHCNSLNTVFDGYYTYKSIKNPRILCKDCNKRHILKTALISSNTNNGEDELLES